MKKRTRRQQAILRRNIFLTCCALVLVGVIALTTFAIKSISNLVNGGNDNSSIISSSQSESTDKTPETKPDSFATVLSIGDIMMHQPQLEGGASTEGYDFSYFFTEVSPYFEKADLTIGNLELTFGGTESGSYKGYPSFNTPDILADNMKDAGINMLMTANNHSYDTGFFGLKRTAQVLSQKGLEYTGTKATLDEPTYVVKDVNGIKIGIANFTYETQGNDPERKYLNGIQMSKEANDYINSFTYQNLDRFYSNAKEIINGMKQDGAEYITFYMHWGEEYQLKANTWQKSMAQQLSNMGVNMIIGGHPHVVQPVEVIHSEDSQNTTICIYSLGNAVSNQRRELISSARKGHTEDGVMFSYTLKKSGEDNSVSLYEVDLIPTWVNKYLDSGFKYTIYPIESIKTATEKYPKLASKLAESYNRTKATVGEGLTECQTDLKCKLTFE